MEYRRYTVSRSMNTSNTPRLMQESAGGTVEPSLPDHFPRHARICASGSQLQAVHHFFLLYFVVEGS